MLEEYRKQLHKIPELSMCEFKTKEYILSKLKGKNFEIELVANNGILAFKKGSEGNSTIAFRADMDALPISEQTGLPFASLHKGQMHACGHDGHMSILLGLADYVSAQNLRENILLIFQPAEESIGGAELIVKSGAMQRYNVKAVFAYHIMPCVPKGRFGIKSGPQMAQATELDITVHGESAHCANPELGIDSIYITSQLINQYQGMVSRRISPLETVVFSLGTISGGTARNIICDKVEMTGTLRTFSKSAYESMKEKVTQINNYTEKIYNCKIDTVLRDMYPPVINDSNLYQVVKSLLSDDEYAETTPLMTSEDFAYYGEVVPSMFIILGSGEENHYFPLHHPKFDFDNKILEQGMNFCIRICNHYNMFE